MHHILNSSQVDTMAATPSNHLRNPDTATPRQDTEDIRRRVATIRSNNLQENPVVWALPVQPL